MLKIALLSDSETGIKIFQKLSENLLKKIADAEISEHFVHSVSDLPFKAKQLAASHGLVFVFSLYEEKTKTVEMVLEKLVEIELETGKKIIKALEESELDDINTEGLFEEERERLASKWVEIIVNTLFNQDKFIPKEEERGFSDIIP